MKNRVRKLFLFFIGLSILPIGFGDWYTVAQKEVVVSPQTSSERAVAYIKSAPNVRYTSIEKAVKVAAANSGKDQIFVIPGTNPTITRNFTLSGSDELIFPYNGETYEDTARSQVDDFADLNASRVNLYRKNLVTINPNITITISSSATMTIGGVLGHKNQSYVGHTVKEYVELFMKQNSKIEIHGTLNIFGYIKEFEGDNNSVVHAKSNGKINLPFVIYDFRGGGFTRAAHDKKVLPFNIFDFPNIRPLLSVEYGAIVSGWVSIPASGSVTKSVGVLIGTGGLFLQAVGSTVTLKHMGSSNLYTTRDAIRATNDEGLINRTIINLYGEVTVSSIKMSVSVASIDTKEYFLSFSYKFHLNVNDGAIANIQNKMKILKGSQITIHEGGIANITNEVIFYQVYFEETTTAGQYYPILFQNVPAKLINNGTLNINHSFAGKIETNVNTAIVNNGTKFSNEVVSLEMISGAGSVSISEQTWKEVTGYAIGHISPTTDPDTTVSRFANGTNTYTSQGEWWMGPVGTGSTVEVIGPLQERQSSSCLTFDSLITMSDGTYKAVGDIRAGDLVKVINHETGEIDVAPITFNDDIDTDFEMFNIVYLEFSNNKTVKVVYEHGFFNLDTMQYVYIDEENYQEFIGSRFVQIIDDEISEVTLEDAYVVRELTKIVSPVSYYHLNIIIEDLLSMPGGIPGLFNIFEYTETLGYDEIKKAADIEMYGLFTYEDFADLVPYEFYAAFPTPYLKVAIGKGLITEEFIEMLINRYLPIANEQH